MRSGGVALDGDCRESGTFAISAIRLKLAFSEISYCTFKKNNTCLIFVISSDESVDA